MILHEYSADTGKILKALNAKLLQMVTIRSCGDSNVPAEAIISLALGMNVARGSNVCFGTLDKNTCFPL